jgi:glutamate/tyrosine decarboxylase-like PLP-dependent enzyme
MTLRAYGRDGVAAWVARNCALAATLAAGIGAIDGLEVIAPVPLNIVCFATRDRDPAARDQLLDRLLTAGDVFLTPTTYGGRPAIRAALSSWRTCAADVERALAAIESAVSR